MGTDARGDKRAFWRTDGFYLVAVGAVLAFLCTFFLSNYDCEAITKWGYDLLESISRGELGNYPRFVNLTFGSPTNYTLFVNAVTALWLSPLYILTGGSAWEASLLYYELWYKVLLAVCLALDVRIFWGILRRLGFDMEKAAEGCGMLLVSSISLLALMGKGQVDVYGFLFFLLGMRAYLRGRNFRMALWLGMAFLVKPLVLWVILPVFLLMMEKERFRVIRYGIVLLVPFLLDKVVTMLVMPEYVSLSRGTAQMMKEYFDGPSMFESMFTVKVNEMLVFWTLALVICFVCYYLAMHDMVKTWHFYFFPILLLILFGIFASVSYHWFIYILPFLIVMGLLYRKKSDCYFLMLGVNGGLALYFTVAETMVILPSLLGVVSGRASELSAVNMQILQSLRPYFFPVGKTVFFVSMLVMGGVFAFEQMRPVKEERPADPMEKRYEKMLLWLQPAPVIVYLGLAAIKWMMG